MLVRILGGLIALLALLGGVGAVWQASRVAAELERFPPPGERFEIDGLALHLDCRGEGTPTVVLEAGLGSGSDSWFLVHDAMAAQTRVCAWDRPGMAWSAPSFVPITSDANADRLHALLASAGVDGPVVLLGMSAGGVFVREYYARHPEHVVGMVLIDSSHEQQGARMPEFPDGGFNTVLQACAWLQPLGLPRLLGAAEVAIDSYGVEIEGEAREFAIANLNRSHTCASLLAESEGFDGEVVDAEPPRSLGDLPLIVVSQGRAPEIDEEAGMTEELVAAFAEVWTELQLELTALSSRGERRIAEESGHVIQLDQPKAVIDAVRDMVTLVREEAIASDP